MKLGIVGLPNVGKSTLFNSLTKAGAESANYPFCTIDPNVGVVAVPDERLKLLGDLYHSKKVTPAVIEFVDIAGLVKGASKGEGLGNQFLSNIREVDAIVHVVRCFEDPNVVHVDGSIDPLRDIETINLELIFSDLEILERRMAKTGKAARMDKSLAKEAELTDTLLRLNREKIDLHIHVVCDRGFRTACNAYEAAKKKASELGESWDIFMELAHCELVHPDDMARPAELGIIINWSCHWSGGYFGEEAMTFFTEEKWRRMYQFNPIIDSGALVTFSSDVVTFYELHRADPFFSMQVAATRVDPEFPLDPDKYPGSVRPPENAKLDVSFLLKGYTINGAKQMHWDKMLGSIEEGKIANMNVCRENIEEYPCDRLTDLSWDAVIFDGKVIRGEL